MFSVPHPGLWGPAIPWCLFCAPGQEGDPLCLLNAPPLLCGPNLPPGPLETQACPFLHSRKPWGICTDLLLACLSLPAQNLGDCLLLSSLASGMEVGGASSPSPPNCLCVEPKGQGATPDPPRGHTGTHAQPGCGQHRDKSSGFRVRQA